MTMPRRHLAEQHGLAGEVLLEGGVLVWPDVIRLNVGKDADLEGKAVHPVHLEPLGGNLHDRALAALIQHLPEILLHQIALRRGVRRRDVGVADDRLDGADESHPVTRALQDGFYHVGGGGLPLGAGHADDLQGIRRIVKPGRRQEGQRLPGVLYLDDGHILRNLYILLHHQGCRPLACHFASEIMAVHRCALDTDKQDALRRLSGIVDQLRDLSVHAPLDQGVFHSFQ